MKTLKKVTDDRVRAYVVWLPIFGGDFRGEARKLSNSFRDKRVSYFIDAESRTGNVWERVLKTERSIAWDVYLLYGTAATWEDEPQLPDFWMHQLHGVTKAPRLDEAGFTAKLKSMLDEMKAPPSTSQAVVNTKDDLLRFTVSNKDKLGLHSQYPGFDRTVNCGTVTKVAFIYFKPISGPSKFAGDAVAVEFTNN